MKKKSFITIGAAAIAVAGVLAGCGGGAGTQTTTAKSSSDATIETVEEVTAQSIAKTVSEKMDEVKSYSFDGETKMNYAVSASGTDMSVKMDMKLNGEGVVESKQVHMNADMDMEMLGQEINKDIIDRVLTYMEIHKVPPYDEETGKGLIRHILIRSGKFSGQIMVCIVANGNSLPYESDLLEHLQNVPGMTSIVLNVNKERTNVILGRKLRTLWGRDEIEDTLHAYDVTEDGAFVPAAEAVTFHISPLSFYQVNPEQTQKLYSLAMNYAHLTGKETVWDLYCGVGTISLFMARRAKKVCGVEIIPEAIENAKQNAARNGIKNAEFFVGKAEEVLPSYVQARKAAGEDPDIDVICVDPPRKGCDSKCLQTILEIRPERVVYVSCDPATLARDLRILADGGYKLRKVRPVDQFGHTVHVETVVCLSKENANLKDYVEIGVDGEDYYRIKNEGKNSAT